MADPIATAAPVGNMNAAGEGRLSRGLVARGAAWNAASSVFLKLSNIAIIAVVARLLTPADFGVFALALAAYMVVSSLAELGLGSVITRSPEEPDATAPTVTTLAIAVSAALSIVLLIGAAPLASLVGSPSAAGPLRILSLSLFMTGVFAVPTSQLAREFRQDWIFFATLVGFVPGNAVLIVFALHGGGAEAFAWSRVVGQLVTGLVAIYGLRRVYLPGFDRRLVSGMLLFGIPLCLANLVNWTLLNADYVIVGRLLTATAVGTYMVAFTVAGWSTAILGPVLNSVVVPGFARVGSDRQARAAALGNSMQIVALVAFPVGAFLVALAHPLVLSLYGDAWAGAAPVLGVLAMYGVLFAVSLLFANVLISVGRTGALLLVQFAWIAALVPTMVWTVRFGLVGVAWAHVGVISIVALPCYWIALRQDCPLRVQELVVRVMPVALRAGAAAVVAGIAAQIVPTEWGKFLAGGCVGGLIYALLVARLVATYLPARAGRWMDAAGRAPLLTLQRCASRLPPPVKRLARPFAPTRLHRSGPTADDWTIPLIPMSSAGALPPAIPVHPVLTPTDQFEQTGLNCLVVTGSLDAGGMDAFVDFLARGLRTRGADVTLLVAGDRPTPGRLASRLRQDGFEVMIADPSCVIDQITAAAPDCVSMHGGPDWVIDAAAARGIPVVETLHGMHTLDGRDRLVARSQKLASMIAVSEMVRRQYAAWVPEFDPGRMSVIPNGVQSRWQPAEARERARTSLGLGDEFVFVSLGRHCIQKNTYGLLAAFESVADAVPDAHLVVAGRVDDPAYFSQVVELRARSHHRDRIHLRDHSERVTSLLAAADGFVLDSFFEGWSLASTEALTSGLPVVLSEVGGAVEQVDWDAAPGIVVGNPLGDPLGVTWDRIAAARFRRQPNAAALIAAMTSVAYDRGPWSRRRDQIASEAERRFAPAVCLDRHLSMLAQVSVSAGVAG